MNRPNLIFYSLKNKKCANFYNYLINNNLNNKFHLINVDTDKSNASKKISVIPTMIIPSINKIYLGDDVYNFFQKPILKENKIKQSIVKPNNDIKQFIIKPNNNIKQSNTKIKQNEIKQSIKSNNENKQSNNEVKQTNNENKQSNIKPNKEVKQNENKKEDKEQKYEVLGYIENEMSGLSDKYFLLNSTVSPIHNYGFY